MPGSIEETWGSLNKQVGSVPKQPARLGGSYCCRPQPLPSYSLYWLRKGVRSSRLQAKVVAGTEQSFLPAEEKGRKTFSFPGFLSSPSPSSVPKSPSRPTPPPPPPVTFQAGADRLEEGKVVTVRVVMVPDLEKLRR